jgi:L-fucose mutarotase/ribose pyranase (RbsD/FucU family)
MRPMTALRSLPLFSMFLLVLLVSCQAGPKNWQDVLHERLPVLGHRNYVVVADSAYPAQSNPGITTIATHADHMAVLKAVLQALDQSPHVHPVVHLDAELASLNDHLAPGIEAYRRDLDALLQGRTVKRELHMDIIKQLDQTGSLFNVLILKTDLTLPYTSVFLELDCGYWDPEHEAALRKAMGN